MNTMMNAAELDDRRLVELHLGGDRGAFRQIVDRYKSLVCALTLSACGNLARSEDLAQEVFIAAWKQLPQLREPEKLRAWLCGIARNLTRNALRSDRSSPTAQADQILPEATPADEGDPHDQAVGADEAALMWRALASLPETYREPMVLFYREHRSVESVAEALEISEETVRQRLARGRAMLSERMAKVVEDALQRSGPTAAFSSAVLLAVPMGMGPVAVMAEAGAATGGAAAKTFAAAGAIGGAAAKGGLALKVLASVAALPALMNGLTDYLRFRAQFEAPAPGSRERAMVAHFSPVLVNALCLTSAAIMFWLPLHGPWFLLGFVPMVVGLGIAIVSGRRQHALCAAKMPKPVFEYRTRGGFLGLPWVHIRAGGPKKGRVARGWIAISDGLALGGLVASGPVAVAPISIGAALGIGVFSIGVLAIGVGALGAASGGIWAMGGIATATEAAKGAIAFSGNLAVGKIVLAAHANDPLARAFFEQNLFFRLADGAWRVAVWGAFFGWVPPLVLMGSHLLRSKRQAA